MGSSPTATVYPEPQLYRTKSEAPERNVQLSERASDQALINRIAKVISMLDDQTDPRLSNTTEFRNLRKRPAAKQHILDALSLEDLEEIMHGCDGELDKFFKRIREKISSVYFHLTKQTLEKMNNNYEWKIHISDTVLRANLNVLKVLGKYESHKFNMERFLKFNRLQKELVSYLLVKYPRNNQSFVPGELMKIFKQFNNVEKPENDVLRNSGTYFGSETEFELVKGVKTLINSIIDELDAFFPIFQKNLQEKVFTIDVDGSKKTVHYKIGRKLPQNTAKFTDFNSRSLDINSPEIIRVIIKWVEDMQEYILRPQSIRQKETLKIVSFLDNRPTFSDINADNYPELVQQLINNLENERTSFNSDLENIIKQLHRFNNNIISILERGDREQTHIPKDEADLIKFSNCSTKFLEWMLAQKLMIVLKILVKTGKQFSTSILNMPIDLVKFNVSDMMRAMMTGSKKEVLKVYENMKALSEKGQITIIKLKNRLSTPLNDAMIIFKVKGSFLICELQLILADNTEGTNDKLKNIQNINHFFYELQRSPYGVLPQAAVLIGYKDSRVSFSNKIHYTNPTINFENCEKKHPECIESCQLQQCPFICYECCIYFNRLQNTFIMKTCTLCEVEICSRCIFKRSPELLEQIRKKNLTNYFTCEISRTIESNRHKKDFKSAGLNASKILECFSNNYIELSGLGSSGSVTRNQFQNWVFEQYCSGGHIALVQFYRSEMSINSIRIDTNERELQICMDPKEEFFKGNSFRYGEFDFLMTYTPQIPQQTLAIEDTKKLSLINIYPNKSQFSKGKYTGFKLGENFFFIFNTVEQKTKNVEANTDEIFDRKKVFKFQSIEECFASMPDLKDARSFVQLANVGLKDKHMAYFNTLEWKLNIKELRISKNCLREIKEVCDNLVNLERLYASENYIAEVNFAKKLPNLKELVLSTNKITKIQNVQNIPNINRINLDNNMLEQFPIARLAELRFLILTTNNIKSKKFLEKSDFPNLLQLSVEQAFDGNGLLADEETKIKIPFKKMNLLKINILKIQLFEISSQKLEFIQCTSSQLEKFSSFSDKIKNISLAFNLIQDLSDLFKTELPFIQKANFSNNNCLIFPKMDCKRLEQLNFSYNQMYDIKNAETSKLPKLKVLYLDNNQLKKFPKVDLPQLTTISLQYNIFNNLQCIPQSNLDKLIEFQINLKQCKLPALQMPSLTRMMLEQISQFDNFDKSNLPELLSFTIQVAQFQVFPIMKLHKLAELSLQNVKLSDFSSMASCQFPKIQLLSINELCDIKQQDPPIGKIFPLLNFRTLKRLDITSSKISSLDSLALSNLQELETLSIYYTPLPSLPKLNLPKLKALTLGSNDLCDLSELFRSDFPILQTMDLSSNKIEQINCKKQKKNFLRFRTLTNLALNYNPITRLQITDVPLLVNFSFISCKLEEFPIIVAPALQFIGFDGNPFKSLTNISKCQFDALNTLNCSFGIQKQTFMQKKLFPLNFKRMVNFSLAHLAYEDISQFAAQSSLPLLESLNLEGNNILKVPALKFSKMLILYLQQNQIEDISGLQLSDLPEVTSIDLSQNLIKSLVPFKAPKLQTLRVNNNKFVTTTSFKQIFCPSLKIIELNDNSELTDVNCLPEKLTNLKCDRCQITSLNAIAKLKNLTELSANQNQISSLLLLQSYPFITEISLSNNIIQSFDNFFDYQYPCLSRLILNQNKITILPSFQAPALSQLNMQQNSLVDIEQFLSKNPPLNLNTLYLNQNKIKSISKLPFQKLYYLYLNSNELTELGFLQTARLTQQALYAFDLSHNKIKKGPKSLKCEAYAIDFGYNEFESIQWLEKCEIKSLSMLTFSNCKFKKLPKIPESCEAMNTLYFNGNPIDDISDFLKTNPKKVKDLTTINMSLAKIQRRQQFQTQINKLYDNKITVGIYDETGNQFIPAENAE